MNTPDTHLYLSPHLDDAILSAGGLVRRQVSAGHRVVIASFCTADNLPEMPLSPLATCVHEKWGAPRMPFAERRSEDVRACNMLGAEWRHLGLPDAIYRRGLSEPGCYETFENLFDEIPSWDARLQEIIATEIQSLVTELAPADIWGPLGIGNNVDHRQLLYGLWRSRDRISAPIWLYEEQPYATGRYPTITHDPIDRAIRSCPFILKSEIHEIEFEAKRAAIMCYASQLSELFGKDLAGLAELETYSRSLLPKARPAERIWRHCADTPQQRPAVS